jgi:hypothetical protein
MKFGLSLYEGKAHVFRGIYRGLLKRIFGPTLEEEIF